MPMPRMVKKVSLSVNIRTNDMVGAIETAAIDRTSRTVDT